MDLDRALAASLNALVRRDAPTDASRDILPRRPARGRAPLSGRLKTCGGSETAAAEAARARTRDVLLVAQSRLQRVLAMIEQF